MKCEDGTFEDALTGARLPPSDARFTSLATLRTIGYALASGLGAVQVECPGLFDGTATIGVERSSTKKWPQSSIAQNELLPGASG